MRSRGCLSLDAFMRIIAPAPTVTPATAGAHVDPAASVERWVPACAGMTMERSRDQSRRQVVPIGVVLLDQLDLPAPVPFLDVLFAQDRAFGIVAGLEIDEPIHAITLRKTGDVGSLVLGDAANEVVGD